MRGSRFFGSWRRDLAEAVGQRAATPPPAMGTTLAIVAVGVAMYVAMAILTGTEQDPAVRFGENAPVTSLSAIFMAMTSALAFACYHLR